MLTGSLGMLPSASLGAKQENGKQNALYEPIHGSAPDIAGKDIANPIATISSLAMMFKYSFSLEKEANLIETAIENILNSGFRTADIAKENETAISCSQMGDEIVKELKKLFEL
jgi:3-isopropylmalate dehydrogenase